MILRRNNRGFTLVELTLSMAFISILLLAIAMLVLQVTSIYNKGLTLRAVNESGRQVATDIQRELNQANPRQVSFAPQPAAAFESASGGRFCIGATVYAWNYGRTIVDNDADPFNVYADGRDNPIRLVKFQKDEKNYCKPNINGVYPTIPTVNSDLLVGGDRDLAIHRFTIDPSESAAGDLYQTMYYVTIRLGTSERGILDSSGSIESSGCEAPQGRVDDEYCAVNNFTFVARAGGTEESSE